MKGSWKTTAAGIVAIVAAVTDAVSSILAGNPIDVARVVAAIVAGIGLIAARDNGVSSESAGAK